ncbi:hypothetical protein GT755_12455 [Herbidospora sp. NEAU-GS84]|uniref:Recombination endonuclease VII n=1 Tax=Herbidospora solisilvae TaxID=2696284 RepID=A0A7C9N2N4_9ACTN|nr:endonuclease domain-containing protein [Herbidospora solisilvae]NAS22494.1 hypothetical protein [Herbidospora solisilvae]
MRHNVIAYLRWRNALPDLSTQEREDAELAFRAAHDGRCAACRLTNERLFLDHDHSTGLVRGLLCRSCNGVMPSTARHVGRALMPRMTQVMVLYTQWPPAAVMGLRERYVPLMGSDPAPLMHKVLWHAGPEGIEHDYERRMERQRDAINRLPSLDEMVSRLATDE